MNVRDVIVIGAGIAGLTATKHLLETRSSLSVVNIEAESFGGLVLNVNELDGRIRGSGIDLASGLMMEAVDRGAESLSERVVALHQGSDGWTVVTSEGEHQARAVIVASGASLKKLGIPGEDDFEHRGVSQCADCDGPLFADKDVVVAGGGDSALQEAHILAQFCRRVLVLNHASEFTAKVHLIEAVASCANVEVKHGTEVTAILGGGSVEKVQIRDLAQGTVGEIACSGFFGFIGLRPSTDFLPPSTARDPAGCVKTDGAFRIGRRLFAAGAVRSGYGGMLEHAIADGLGVAGQAMRELS